MNKKIGFILILSLLLAACSSKDTIEDFEKEVEKAYSTMSENMNTPSDISYAEYKQFYYEETFVFLNSVCNTDNESLEAFNTVTKEYAKSLDVYLNSDNSDAQFSIVSNNFMSYQSEIDKLYNDNIIDRDTYLNLQFYNLNNLSR